MSDDFWRKFERWTNSLKIDSVSIAGVRVGFKSAAFNSSAYDQIVSILRNQQSANFDVFVMSAQNIDEVYKVDRVQSDHECETSVYLVSPGGSGANTAFALARMGWKTHIAGVIGRDAFGELLKESLLSAGVGSDLLKYSSKEFTGRTVTIVEDSGRRMIVVRPGANDIFHDEFTSEELLRKARHCKVFHSSSFVAQKARLLQEQVLSSVSGKVVTSLTPGALYAREGLDRIEGLLRYTNIVFLYKEQLLDLVQKSSGRVYLRGQETTDLLSAYFAWKERKGFSTPQIFVVKDPLQVAGGKIGQSFVSAGAGCSSLETYVPPRILDRKIEYSTIDTTGAGDCSAAGVIHAILRESSLDHAVDTAFLMAALSSTQIGARTALTSDEQSETGRLLPKFSSPSLTDGTHI